MKNLCVNESLFHGIRNTSYESPIDILESILIDKYILTHQSLRTKGKAHEREGSCFQGTNATSICYHPTNNILHDKFKSSGITLTNELPAFEQFVNITEPSIILDNKLLNELPFRSFGGYKRMIDEIQVLSDIPLSYAKAIGYKDITNDLINKFKIFQAVLVKKDEISYKQHLLHYYENVLKIELQKVYENIAVIKYLLQKYNYQIPIIDPLNGKIYQDFDEEEQLLKKALHL